ncbi:MAG: CvpA family protein [Phycisphaerae bacterium]|jgi:hypothetical protein
MAYISLALVAGLFGVYGYWRGASRFGLALVPLIFASLLAWLLGPVMYRVDSLRNLGLIWPGLMLVFAGLIGGYVVRALLRMKLKKKLHPADRVGGSLIGIVIGVIVVWLGCVVVTTVSAKGGGGSNAGSAADLARTLNKTAIRWIPGVGTGSDTLTDLMDIAAAGDDARRRAVEELGLDRLSHLPEMQAVVEDSVTQADIDKAAGGSVTALLRLQKDPRILRLLETQDVREFMRDQSIGEIADTIRRYQDEGAEDGSR